MKKVLFLMRSPAPSGAQRVLIDTVRALDPQKYALTVLVIYGGIMNPASALMWTQSLEWEILLTYYLTGIPMDCIHAASTGLFLWFGAEPMLEKLDRIKVKYGLLQ